MHIASHLWRSPHGIYYFRETGLVFGKQVARRISLHTKDPIEAKRLSVQMLAQIAQGRDLMKDIKNFNLDDIRSFEVAITPRGVVFKNGPSIPNDMEQMAKFMRDHAASLVAAQHNLSLSSPPQPAVDETITSTLPSPTPPVGATIDEVVERYTNRKQQALAPKTIYQYLQYIKIFKEWLEAVTCPGIFGPVNNWDGEQHHPKQTA